MLILSRIAFNRLGGCDNVKEVKVTTDDLMSVQDAAKALSRPRYTIYRWIEAGKIIGLRFGGILFIPVSEVERLRDKQGGAGNE